jgi:hypothetical protein
MSDDQIQEQEEIFEVRLTANTGRVFLLEHLFLGLAPFKIPAFLLLDLQIL